MEKTREIEKIFRYTTDFILQLTTNHEQTLDWCRSEGLLPRTWQCCGEDCAISLNKTSIDGQNFRCRTCAKRHKVRKESMFDDFRRVPLILLIRTIFYYWVNGYAANRIFRLYTEIQISFSYATYKRIYTKIRHKVLTYMENEVYNNKLLGNVQMDEALFTHRPAVGRKGLMQVWVIGMLEEYTSEGLCFVVENRNRHTINRLIKTYVTPGSRIIHDGWGGYMHIPSQYNHYEVLPDKYKGTDIPAPYTMNRIEELWEELRTYIRNMYCGGVVEDNLNDIIQEGLWRRRCKIKGLSEVETLIQAIVG